MKTPQQIKDEVEKENSNEGIYIFLFLWLFFVSIFLVLIIFELSDINNKIDNKADRYCHNETYIAQEQIFEQVRCPCCPENGTSCCMMYCSKNVGYKNVTLEKEVCEIK
jgi:hypothetical protein